MSKIYIVDTGYANVNATGTKLPIQQRAGYDGSSGQGTFELNVTSIVLNGGVELMNQSELHNNEQFSDVTPITHKNPSFSIACSIKVSSIPTTGFQYSWLWQLMRLERTKGVKLLVIDETTVDRASHKYNLEMFAERYVNTGFASTVFASSTTKFVPVHLSVQNVTNSSDNNHLRFNITATIAGELD